MNWADIKARILKLNMLYPDCDQLFHFYRDQYREIALLVSMCGYAFWLKGQLTDPSLNSLVTETTTICETVEAIC